MTHGIDFVVHPYSDDGAPVAPEGWEAAPDNPFVHLRKMRECGHREIVEQSKDGCSRCVERVILCNLIGERVTRDKCYSCR